MSREQIVRDTAYAIWEAEGKPEGRHEEHWRQAETRVAQSAAAVPRKAPGRPAAAKPPGVKSTTSKPRGSKGPAKPGL